jgi:hypothetical protein
MERIIGTISGSNFVVRTSPSTGRGADGTSDAAHTSPVVEYIPNAEDMNDQVDGILVAHDQTGIHKSGATYAAPVFSGTATGTYTLGGTPTITSPTINTPTITSPTITTPTLTLANATTMTTDGGILYDRTNEKLLVGDGTNTQALQTGAWTAWTPSWTNLTPGSGTNTGSYCVIGKTVFFRAVFIFGSGSAVGNTPIITLPVTIKTYTGITVIGNAYIVDSGAVQFMGSVLSTGTIICFVLFNSYLAHANVTTTVPMTWTTSDAIVLEGFYEAA